MKTQVSGSAVAMPAGAPGNLTYNLDNSSATFSANFAAGTVQTEINLVPTTTVNSQTATGNGMQLLTYALPAITLGTLSGTGSIATGTQRFSGTLTASVGPFSNGNFGGAFFGPQAAEFGFAFAAVGPAAGTAVTGTVVGGK